MKKAILTVHVPPHIKRHLQEIADANYQTLTALVTQILLARLKEESK